MATKSTDKSPDAAAAETKSSGQQRGAPVSDTGTGDNAYASEEGETGKPVGPDNDGSFHAPDFYDPKTGERIGTPWDSEQQMNDPGIGEPGENEGRPEKAKGQQGARGQDKTTGASGGEAGEHTRTTGQSR